LCCRWLPRLWRTLEPGSPRWLGWTTLTGQPVLHRTMALPSRSRCGSDGSGGLFAVDQTSSPYGGSRLGLAGGLSGRRGARVRCRRTTAGPRTCSELETPIKAFVCPNPTNQIYSGAVWVVQSVRDSALGDCGTAGAAGRYGGQHGWLGRWRWIRVDQQPRANGVVEHGSALHCLCCLVLRPTRRRRRSFSAIELVRTA